MKQFTITEIRSWRPCYDPSKYLSENWCGTALDILNDKRIPFQDRLWVIMRINLVSEKLMRLFAVWCARQVQHLMSDQRSLDVLDFMEAYAEYRWIIDDPDWAAGWEEDRDAAGDAARDAAWDAARDAAWTAAWATGDAAWAAEGAARDAAWTAAWAAGGAARDAAWAAARDPMKDAQETKLREMLIAGVETGDAK